MSGAQINLLEEIIVDNFAGGGGASAGRNGHKRDCQRRPGWDRGGQAKRLRN